MAGADPAPLKQRPPSVGGFERWLNAVWWQPTPGPAARALWPLSLVYRALAWLDRRLAGQPAPTPVPVIVVGNLVVGGAGKTPVVIALVQALRAAGRHPGVISRGHGARPAQGAEVRAVDPQSSAREVGDEPLLIHLRAGVPVFVGRRRAAAAQALCAAHPHVDVLVSDDGLQHHALARVAEVVVFDDRGAGNGLLLPAGPLRQPLPKSLPQHVRVAYSGTRVSTVLPGTLVPRSAVTVVPLAAWSTRDAAAAKQPLSSLRGRKLTALAGIGAPEQFFRLLEAAGLHIERLALPDHADYLHAPWPEGTREVITTEKDAVKLAALPRHPAADPTVWVLPLDCQLPEPLVRDLLALLPGTPAGANPPPQEPQR